MITLPSVSGKPRGAQSVYNRVMWRLFEADDSVHDSKAKLLAIPQPKTGEEKVAAKLRRIMKVQAASREYLAQKVVSVDTQQPCNTKSTDSTGSLESWPPSA